MVQRGIIWFREGQYGTERNNMVQRGIIWFREG